MKHGWILLAALLAFGCQRPSEPAPEQKATRLLQGCREANRLLNQMQAAESSFRFDQSGNATISKALWDSIPASVQDGLTKAVAYNAVCASGELRAQRVTIRSSEASEVLVQQTVTEFDQ